MDESSDDDGDIRLVSRRRSHQSTTLATLQTPQPDVPPEIECASSSGAAIAAGHKVGSAGLSEASPSGADTHPHTGSSRSPGPSTGCDTGSSSSQSGPQRMPMPPGAVLTPGADQGTFQPRALFLPSKESTAPTAPKRKLPFPVQPEAPSRTRTFSCRRCGQPNSHYAPKCPNPPPAPPSLQPAAAPPHQHPTVPPAAAATASAALSAPAQPQAGSAVDPVDIDADWSAQLAQMHDMGFSDADSWWALENAGGDVDRAIDLLLPEGE